MAVSHAFTVDCPLMFSLFLFNDTAPPEIYTLSLHDALPIFQGTETSSGDSASAPGSRVASQTVDAPGASARRKNALRSEEHTSELQSRGHLVCRLLLEKKKQKRATT